MATKTKEPLSKPKGGVRFAYCDARKVDDELKKRNASARPGSEWRQDTRTKRAELAAATKRAHLYLVITDEAAYDSARLAPLRALYAKTGRSVSAELDPLDARETAEAKKRADDAKKRADAEIAKAKAAAEAEAAAKAKKASK